MSLLNVFVRICVWVLIGFFSLVLVAKAFTYFSIVPAIIASLFIIALDLLALVRLLRIY